MTKSTQRHRFQAFALLVVYHLTGSVAILSHTRINFSRIQYSSPHLSSTCDYHACKPERKEGYPPKYLQTSKLYVSSSATNSKESEPIIESQSSDVELVKHALLISSFEEGVQNSPDAKQFLKNRIISALASEHIQTKEQSVIDSVINSPCCGPDIDQLNDLEKTDKNYSAIAAATNPDQILHQLLHDSREENDVSSLELRFLYIPTAMYALTPGSTNTPGKQRQRKRADGKKRRTLVIQVLQELFQGVDILGVTLDLDDSSIKQPVGSDNASKFPTNGVEAINDWKPHLIYVEGGNTFWLQHCIEKGNWAPLLRKACMGDTAAVYLGKSAGAIVAGKSVETALWKGWDDPSVVQGMENKEDWDGVEGFGFMGDISIFPHMDESWENLVNEKKASESDKFDNVLPLRQWEALCVDGDMKKTFICEGDH